MNPKSVGALVYCNGKFLLIKQLQGHYWGFPKGHIEENENTLTTLKRELKEEIGLIEFTLIPGFQETVNYDCTYDNEKIARTNEFYLVKTKSFEVKLDTRELESFKWLSFEQAMNHLRFPNLKKVLEKANAFLNK